MVSGRWTALRIAGLVVTWGVPVGRFGDLANGRIESAASLVGNRWVRTPETRVSFGRGTGATRGGTPGACAALEAESVGLAAAAVPQQSGI